MIIKNAVKNTYRLWPEQEIPYVISNSFGTQERSVIRAAMEQFSRQGPILSNWFCNRSTENFETPKSLSHIIEFQKVKFQALPSLVCKDLQFCLLIN